MKADQIRQSFLSFFEKNKHKILPSSPLVPENDPSVLFTTAGMQQFKEYYGAPEMALRDFDSKNITTSQKCVRTGDIDEVGDETHLTFFEMLGNFSFGGYGRKEAITLAHDFITKELNLPISYVTYYKGEGVVPKDEESRSIWESLGVADIREDGKDVFWGPTGVSGPCGPTTEIYCKNALGMDVEVWNIVFNEYFCDGSREELDKGKATLKKAEVLGIDTGMGFERLLATVEARPNVYSTSIFEKIIEATKQLSAAEKNQRIIADHFRTAVFLISDGVIPSNKDRGYILRRLLRRILMKVDSKKLTPVMITDLVTRVVDTYAFSYPNMENKIKDIISVIEEEVNKFDKTIAQGLKEFQKGTSPFILATTYGFPIELTEELAQDLGTIIDREEFDQKMREHQEKSRIGLDQKFKGGLANTNEQTVKLHTAHHLLLRALQEVLGVDVKQRGSNITEERLRIDFTFDRKLTEEEKQAVEKKVNEKIEEGLTVVRRELPKEEALKLGAEMEFGTKYPDVVSVYFIEDKNHVAYSKEFCGGPHVTNTHELGKFVIQKEEAVSQGIRRIKAVLT